MTDMTDATTTFKAEAEAHAAAKAMSLADKCHMFLIESDTRRLLDGGDLQVAAGRHRGVLIMTADTKPAETAVQRARAELDRAIAAEHAEVAKKQCQHAVGLVAAEFDIGNAVVAGLPPAVIDILIQVAAAAADARGKQLRIASAQYRVASGVTFNLIVNNAPGRGLAEGIGDEAVLAAVRTKLAPFDGLTEQWFSGEWRSK